MSRRPPAYYADFGLTAEDGNWFATTDGGRQLRIEYAPTRRVVELRVAADDADDLARVAASLSRLGMLAQLGAAELDTVEPVTGMRGPARGRAPAGPGTRSRDGVQRAGARSTGRIARAPGFIRPERVRPRKLGHAVMGSTDYGASMSFFVDGLGFKVSDKIKGAGAFMRCSTDHHNVLVLNAPVNFLHHTSWQVDDVDDVGRGAFAMLEGNPERHVWGLGRHYAGSNFFWYLKDPAGNFSEYYSDMDCIVDDQLWTPEDLEGARGLFAWGPPPPPSFLHPDDLAALMTGAHAPS